MENFWDSNTWGTYLILGVLFASLLLANTLKRKIPLLQKFSTQNDSTVEHFLQQRDRFWGYSCHGAALSSRFSKEP